MHVSVQEAASESGSACFTSCVDLAASHQDLPDIDETRWCTTAIAADVSRQLCARSALHPVRAPAASLSSGVSRRLHFFH
jgi:hypothetical protein